MLRDSILSPKHTLDTVDDHQARGTEDQIWVRKFAEAGGEAIVGADGKMLSRPHEVVAIFEAGLRIVVLPAQWARAPRHIQMSFVFYWWPSIEKTLEASKAQECHKVPWSWSDAPITRVPIDFQGAYKKVKKAAK